MTAADEQPGGTATPTLTIAIPSYQRRAKLEALLDSLSTCLAPPPDVPVDVVVVLDGSTDGSRELIEGLVDGFPVPLRVEWQPNGGPAAARNHCFDTAEGELVWLLDDDILANREALERHLAWDRERAPVLTGPYDIHSDDPLVSLATEWYDERHERLSTVGLVTNPVEVSFANASAPTALLREHRMDERYRGYGMEDIDLAVRLLDAGVEIAFDPGTAVVHAFNPSPTERLRKRREEGANRVRFVTLHPHRRDLVFEEHIGRLERGLRRIDSPAASTPLWGLGRAVLTLTGTPLPARWRAKALSVSEVFALYSGVAAEGGIPD